MDTKKKTRQKKTRGKVVVVNDNLKREYPDRMKYFGTVKLKFDPVEYQRKERDEW